MSQGRNPWQGQPPQRNGTNQSNQLDAGSGSGLPFRPNAPNFTPRASVLNIQALNLDSLRDSLHDEVSHPSHYHLLASTFMPPETPPIPGSPVLGAMLARDQAMRNGSHPLRLDTNLPISHAPNYHPSALDFATRLGQTHSRGSSDLVSAHSGLGFEQIARPRSRSEGPWMNAEHAAFLPGINDGSLQAKKALELAAPASRRSADRLLSFQAREQRPHRERHRASLPQVPEASEAVFDRDHSEDRGSPGGIRLPTDSDLGFSVTVHGSTRSERSSASFSRSEQSTQRGSLHGTLNHRDFTPWNPPRQQNQPQGSHGSIPTFTKYNGRSSADLHLMSSGGVESLPSLLSSSHTASPLGTASVSSRSSSGSQDPTRQLYFANTGSPLHTTGAKYLAQLIKSNAVIPAPPATQHGWQVPQNISPVTPVQTLDFSPPSLQHVVDPLIAKFQSQLGLSLTDAFDNVPFIDNCRFTAHHVPRQAASYGVVKISDVPYSTTRNEVAAFLGNDPSLIHYPASSPYFAIHIIMERSTAKSMDCFAEYAREESAQLAVARFAEQARNGKRPRIGDRHVRVELSSQEQLMSELFPKTKCVHWNGQDPTITAPVDAYSSHFKGFITSEELVMTIRWAEHPGRSNYTYKHLQRVYESMISLLVKYPWWKVDLITLNERNLIFHATVRLIRALVPQIHPVAHPGVPGILTVALLTELALVALSAPAFSESQRAQIIDALSGIIGPPLYIPLLAPEWPFEILRKKDDASMQLLEYYVGLLKTATTPAPPVSLAERSAYQAAVAFNKPFGKFTVNWPAGREKGCLTIAEAAYHEWCAVEHALRLVVSSNA